MLPERFFDPQNVLTQEELTKIAETPHRVLLGNAFGELSWELAHNGNTQRLQLLREEHARIILAYWGMVKDRYFQAQEDGRISKEIGEELIEGDERITVMQLGVYERDDEQVFSIYRRAPYEKDEVRITAIEGRGIDEFLFPPTIKSEFQDPDEKEDLTFELVIRQGKISTFTKATVHSAPDHSLPYIKDIKTIDFSIFGVETLQ